MKAAYLYFSFRHFKKENRMIVAAALYSSIDANSKNLLGVKVEEVRPWADDNYVKIIQSYANALNYAYEKQDKLSVAGYDTIVLCTSNQILYGWLINNECNSNKKWFTAANRPFRSGGIKEIYLDVALGRLAESDVTYKYCKLELVEAKLELTYRGVKSVSESELTDNERDNVEVGLLGIEQLLERENVASDIQFAGFVS